MSVRRTFASNPRPPTSALVGRRQELDTLARLLSDRATRLITLVGPGGIGKTRLALAAAERLRRGFDGVAFVDLTVLEDSRLVLTAVAHALDVPIRGDRLVLEALSDQIGHRRFLLILDNFEHVLDAARDVSRLMEACPGVVVLVTTRAALHIDAERLFVVGSLALPDPGPGQDPQVVAFVESVSLFVARAQAARPDFQLTQRNVDAVVNICVRLDGMPLAIELAAARVKVLAAEQIDERLADRFALLTNGGCDRPARHRTLQAVLDWTYRMLGQPEQALLRRMSVFADGSSVEAVERVCATPGRRGSEVRSHLRSLIHHSLIRVDEHGDGARYVLLETVRQYALRRLRDADDELEVRERHAAWFLDLAERANPELVGPEQVEWMNHLAREYANLRQAIAWYLESRAPEPALRMANALWKFCEVRGHSGEGESWLNAGLALGHVESTTRSMALHAAANLAYVRGDYDKTLTLHDENLALRQRLGDRLGVGITLLHIANVQRNRGQAARSLELCRESLAAFRELGAPSWCALTLNTMGMALLDRREFSTAQATLDEALALFRTLGRTRGVAIALGNLGDVHRAEGDFARADTRLRQSLELFKDLGDAWGSSATLESLALVAAASGNAARAAVLFGAAEAQRKEAGAVLAPADVPEHEHVVESLRLRLGSGALQTFLAQGRMLPPLAAVEFSEFTATLNARPTDSSLTGRQRQVTALVARGFTDRQIAEELVITHRTAEKHVANILDKVGATTRTQLAVWWVARVGLPAG